MAAIAKKIIELTKQGRDLYLGLKKKEMEYCDFKESHSKATRELLNEIEKYRGYAYFMNHADPEKMLLTVSDPIFLSCDDYFHAELQMNHGLLKFCFDNMPPRTIEESFLNELKSEMLTNGELPFVDKAMFHWHKEKGIPDLDVLLSQPYNYEPQLFKLLNPVKLIAYLEKKYVNVIPDFSLDFKGKKEELMKLKEPLDVNCKTNCVYIKRVDRKIEVRYMEELPGPDGIELCENFGLLGALNVGDSLINVSWGSEYSSIKKLGDDEYVALMREM